MFIIKENYYLYIENLEDLDIDKLRKNKKINIIYRDSNKYELSKIIRFRRMCKLQKYKFFVSNNLNLAKECKADGLYISSHNKKKYHNNIPKIGSAHNLREIRQKLFQDCKVIIFSRLFKTKYKYKKSFFGVLKYNLLIKNNNIKMIPLGGIKNENLLKLNMVKSKGFASLSAVKKKPAITSRLF